MALALFFLGIQLLCLMSITRAADPGTLVLVAQAQGGLMSDTGPLNPHAYRPNEFVVQNMLYEGLVYYGKDGKIEPALAESWDISAPAQGSEETAITFKLRRQVCQALFEFPTFSGALLQLHATCYHQESQRGVHQSYAPAADPVRAPGAAGESNSMMVRLGMLMHARLISITSSPVVFCLITAGMTCRGALRLGR